MQIHLVDILEMTKISRKKTAFNFSIETPAFLLPQDIRSMGRTKAQFGNMMEVSSGFNRNILINGIVDRIYILGIDRDLTINIWI